MKICLFGDASSPHIRQLAAQLAARDWNVHIVSHKEIEVPGATVERFRVPPAGIARPFRWHTRHTHYLRGFLRRFDIVNLHFLHDWGFTPQIIAEGCFVATPWGSDIVHPPEEEAPSPTLRKIRRQLLQHATAVTVFGKALAKETAAFAEIDIEAIHLAPLGVDLDRFQPSQNQVKHSSLEVGFYKGFRAVYGPRYLIEAIPKILSRVPAARFCLIGEGAQLGLCRQIASDYGIDQAVEWFPYQPLEKLPKFLGRWALSAIPSVCESFGVAALESSAMQVPVVASAIGGLSETVRHDETGLLVPPAEPDALADAIVKLLLDPDRRHRYGEAGRRLVEENFSWSLCVDQWLVAYEIALQATCRMV